MQSLLKVGCLLVASCIAGIPALIAQPQSCCKGMPQYDTTSESTITGTVQDVLQTQRGQVTGTHLMVKAESGVVDVRLGPTSFLTRQGFTFAKGEQVEITGSKTTINGSEVVIAREVMKDSKKLTLRDKTGRPMWTKGR